ncbi:alpha/beta fold hydrolase [Streptomyces armeniacus]|uniref:Alpha/beta fold hydrolase n=1 Tax=Streptomyces armeniacus TaxID=83291 RepID=A0A345XZB8_9ACTN|nr:alpha/beta fold hydrolase [Streptomyces armeniacus]AXK36984.1 alpha/beta fold hydrolase [Streptomyces armeniacus]
MHARLDGDGPPLVLGPSLGTSLAVWEPQLAALAGSHRVLRWDLPGHGGSPAALLPGDGSATVARLAALVLRLADAHGWRRFAYAGISLGGAVGLHLAAHTPERLSSLAVVCSSARFGDAAVWRERAALVRAQGTAPLAEAAAGRWFSPSPTPPDAHRTEADAQHRTEADAHRTDADAHRTDAARTDADARTGADARTALRARLLDDLRAADPYGYAACCDALAAYDLRARLPYVTTPTLVVAGLDDPATPSPHARELADGIPDARLSEVPRAAHLANVDQPHLTGATLHAHFAAPHAAGGDPGDSSRT